MAEYKNCRYIYNIYKTFKENGYAPRCKGRTAAIELNEVVAASKKILRDHTSDINVVNTKHMKSIIYVSRKNQAYDDGLDTDSVYCAVSTQT